MLMHYQQEMERVKSDRKHALALARTFVLPGRCAAWLDVTSHVHPADDHARAQKGSSRVALLVGLRTNEDERQDMVAH